MIDPTPERRILEIASTVLEKGEHSDDGHCAPDWSATKEQLVEFAHALYAEGYENGYDDGCYESTGGEMTEGKKGIRSEGCGTGGVL